MKFKIWFCKIKIKEWEIACYYFSHFKIRDEFLRSMNLVIYDDGDYYTDEEIFNFISEFGNYGVPDQIVKLRFPDSYSRIGVYNAEDYR